MIELEYPPLPPGHYYRKLREANGYPGFIPGQKEDVDIMQGDIGDMLSVNFDYPKALRAYISTFLKEEEDNAYIRWNGEIVFRDKFASTQEALNVVVARLWLGLDRGEG